MNKFEKHIEIRWADLDPNFHVLHSKYYDFGAYCRMAFMVEHGLTPAVFMKHHFGPIIFREECIFKKEITFGDKVTVSFKVEKITADAVLFLHDLTQLDAIEYIAADARIQKALALKLPSKTPKGRLLFSAAPVS